MLLALVEILSKDFEGLGEGIAWSYENVIVG
jgi:hypothetical protein